VAIAIQDPDFTPKKIPAQRRSRDTFEALVEACTRLLPEQGYAGTTTNHIAERAGVGIASLYEYFPGKDAIVAQVAERLVQRVLARLAEGARALQDAPAEDAFRLWIELIYATVEREKQLVAVFLYQIPYTNRLDPIRAVGAKLMEFSQQARRRAGTLVRSDLSDASLQLVINLVTSTIMQLLLDPPTGVTHGELLDELVVRVESWMRG
jgi:AcrR family transcriptional regulator